MIRTVQTADIIANELNMGVASICVESGLVEEAKSFRGKTANEPRPCWSPLVLDVEELKRHSDRIDDRYVSLHAVLHEKDDSKPNTVSEVHSHLTDRDEITRDRCKTVIRQVISADHLADDVVLLVGHGATVLAFSRVLENELPEDQKIKGERNVSCFAEFRPVDPANPLGSWRSVSGFWDSGEEKKPSVENLEDLGFAV
jgi:broad specificity phosphatase PhoE